MTWGHAWICGGLRLPQWRTLEAYDFWYQQNGSSSVIRSELPVSWEPTKQHKLHWGDWSLKCVSAPKWSGGWQWLEISLCRRWNFCHGKSAVCCGPDPGHGGETAGDHDALKLLFSWLIHTGTKGDLEQIYGLYRVQEAKVKDMGIQVEFSSVLQLKGKCLVGLNNLWVTSWLHGWCHKQYIGFYDHVVKSFFPDRRSSQREM